MFETFSSDLLANGCPALVCAAPPSVSFVGSGASHTRVFSLLVYKDDNLIVSRITPQLGVDLKLRLPSNFSHPKNHQLKMGSVEKQHL